MIQESKLAGWVRAQAPASVAEVAARFGIKRVALYRLMRGDTLPRRKTAVRIETETLGAVKAVDLYAGAGR